MHIQFTHHAQIRLHERKFSIEDMKQVILKPDFTRYVDGDKIVSKKQFNRGGLEVVYRKNGNVYVIITVYFSN